MNTLTYKNHDIEIGEASKSVCDGGRVRWYRHIYIDGQFVTSYQHKTLRQAVFYAQRVIEARDAEQEAAK